MRDRDGAALGIRAAHPEQRKLSRVLPVDGDMPEWLDYQRERRKVQ